MTNERLDMWAGALAVIVGIIVLMVSALPPSSQELAKKDTTTFGNVTCTFSADGETVYCSGREYRLVK